MAQKGVLAGKKPRTQARGRARRSLMIRTAKELLDEKPLESVSLGDIAGAAGVPKGSAYHFFASANDVFMGVAHMFAEEFVAEISRPYELGDDAEWFDIYREAAARVRAIYASNPSYRQVIIGGAAPPEIKLSDRENDELVGRLLLQAIDEHFELPQIPRLTEVLFYSIEIVDLFWMLSMMRHDCITDEIGEESLAAAYAYLRTYLPSKLPRRKSS